MSQNQNHSDLVAPLSDNPGTTPYQAITVRVDAQQIPKEAKAGASPIITNPLRDNISELPESKKAEKAWFFIFLLFSAVFWFQLNGLSETICSNPVWFWANYAKYYYTAISVLLLVNVFCFPSSDYVTELPSSSKSLKQHFYSFITLVTILSSLALIPGFTITFINRDLCPDLNVVIWVFFILTCLILAYMSYCCCVGIMLASRVASISARNLLGYFKNISHVFSFHRRNNNVEDDVVEDEDVEATETENQKN